MLRSKSLESSKTPFSLWITSSLCYLPNMCAESNHFLIPSLDLVQVILILCPDFCISLLTGLFIFIFASIGLFSSFTRLCHYMAQNSPMFPISSRVKAKVITAKTGFILASLYNCIRRMQVLNLNN